jgi:hypothetical protein
MGRGATDSLAELAGKREHGINGAFGAHARLPLAVFDRVCFERPHQGADDAEAETEDGEQANRELGDRRRSQSDADAAASSDSTEDDVRRLLPPGTDENGTTSAATMPPTVCTSVMIAK